MYSNYLDGILRCPKTLKPMKINGNCYESGNKVYKAINNILSIVYPAELGGDDAKYNKIYNIFVPHHDLNKKSWADCLPVLTW